MALRVTQHFVEYAAAPNNANLRVTTHYVGVVASDSLARNLRVTSHYTSISASASLTRELRVTGTYAEVLGKPGTPEILEANNVITLTQSETVGAPRLKGSVSTVGISDQADVSFTVFGRVASSTLSLSQTAEPSIHNLTATNDIDTDSWVQFPRLADTFSRSAEHTVTLTQDLPQPTGKRSVSAVQVIPLLQLADNNVKQRDVTTAITMSDAATAEKIYNAVSVINITQETNEGFLMLYASNTIVLNHLIRPNPLERFAASTLDIQHTATSSIKVLFAASTIDLSDTAYTVRPWYATATSEIIGIGEDVFVPPIGPLIPGDPFGMTDSVSVEITGTRVGIDFLNFLSISDVVLIKAGATDLAATTAISLTSAANLSSTADAATVIDGLTQSATVAKNTADGLNQLSMIDEARYTIARATRDAPNTIAMKQSVGYSLIRDTTDCDYTPFIGASDATTTPPPITLPAAKSPTISGTRFRLAYPAFDVGGTIDFIDLRSPAFGNRERLDATRINRETHGGNLIIFADPNWPEVQTLQMTFEGLKSTQARGLITFIERWLGREIGVFDHEGRAWKGVIVNPNEAVTQDGTSSFSASLEIEAERVS